MPEYVLLVFLPEECMAERKDLASVPPLHARPLCEPLASDDLPEFRRWSAVFKIDSARVLDRW